MGHFGHFVTETLIVVPTRTWVTNGYALPEAREVLKRIGAAALAETTASQPDRVFLSRSSYNRRLVAAGRKPKRPVPNEEKLDALFAERGFTVIYPEEIDVRDQVRLGATAEIIVGSSGSAVHLAGFAQQPIRVVEVADLRTMDQPLPNQQVLDSLCGHTSGLIPYRGTADGYDLEAVHVELIQMGI